MGHVCIPPSFHPPAPQNTNKNKKLTLSPLAPPSSVETNVSIIVACVPTMKPLCVSLLARFGASKTKAQIHAFAAPRDDYGARCGHGGRGMQGFRELEVWVGDLEAREGG